MAYNQFELLRQRRFLPFFVVQSLGAFNDNVYRQAIIGLLASIGLSASEQSLYTNLAPALFILPFFLFSATAGQIAEKLEKSRLIRITTTMEIVIMSVAAVGFLLQNMPLLLVALFGTGLQSALFGPVKYSILPSVLKPEELTGGNGLVEMGTSISILIGMFAGGLIFELAGRHGPETAAAAIVALAITGNLVSRLIPPVDAGMPDLKVNINPIPESRRVIALAKKQLAVRNAMLGVSWFWFFGTLLTAQMLTYAQVNLGGTPSLYLMPLALFSIGTGIGSLLCEKLSARTVEIGLVPLGAFGMSAFLLDLYFARPDAAAATALSLAEFVRAPGSLRIMIDFTGIGLFAGIFIVPLFALIQSRTPKQEISRVISAVNIQNAMFIVLAAVAGIALQMEQFKVGDTVIPMPGLSIPQLFLCLAIANTVVAIWIFTIVPEFLMRFLSWVLVRALYRLELHGIEKHVPDEGPALIVCNHVTYMDALILSASIPRPVRFVMYYRIFNIPVMRWIFRTGKAIPIAGAKEDPEIMRRAFDAVDAALAAECWPRGSARPCR
jgi:MFS family permease